MTVGHTEPVEVSAAVGAARTSVTGGSVLAGVASPAAGPAVVEVVAVTGEVEEVDQEEAILVLTTLPWEQVRTRMAVVATAAVVDGKPSVLALKV